MERCVAKYCGLFASVCSLPFLFLSLSLSLSCFMCPSLSLFRCHFLYFPDTIVFGTHRRSQSTAAMTCWTLPLYLSKPSDKIKLLGATLDNKLIPTGYVKAVCKATFFHIRALPHMWSVLTDDTAKTVACALMVSRLDYANSILYVVSGANIHKLQRMQNTIARVVKLSRSNTGVMDILKDLHWLPVRNRIDFKIAALMRSSSQPVYLSSLISDYAPIRSPRATWTHIRHTPHVKTAVGSRAFSSSAPKVWNSLPADIRDCTTLLTFRRKLNTFYFNQAFN